LSYSVLAPVSEGYPKVQGRFLTCYSPVRRSSTPKGLSARLACVKHAASVRPEPGSNSPTKSVENCPDNKKLVAKGKPPRISRQKPTTLKAITNWHWLIKHPVEFSKNNHTPRNNHPSRRPIPGALVQLYSRYFTASNPDSRTCEAIFAQDLRVSGRRKSASFSFGVWQDGRCGSLRCLARFPAGSLNITGRFPEGQIRPLRPGSQPAENGPGLP
jgi:hypothetical protein